MRTYFFDYTVNSAYTCKEFEGYTPAEGNKLLVAELTVKNTDRSTVTMYDTDFQIQWGDDDDDDAFDAPITYYSDAVSDDQLPEEYDLSVNEERTGLLVFEVPEDSKDYSISYLEQFSNETKEMYSLYISLQRISKINHIIYESKDRSTVDHSAPVFLLFILIYNYIIFP